jgi:hypothetical protein
VSKGAQRLSHGSEGLDCRLFGAIVPIEPVTQAAVPNENRVSLTMSIYTHMIVELARRL